MISIGWNNVSSMWWEIVSSSLTSSKFMKAYPTLRWKPWEEKPPQNIHDEGKREGTNLQLFAKSRFDTLDRSPCLWFELRFPYQSADTWNHICCGWFHQWWLSAYPKKVRNAPAVMFRMYLSLLSELFLPDQFCLECCAALSGVFDLCQVAARWGPLA